MKQMAIVTPGFLPVPAVKGGAVEVLIEELIKGNENSGQFKIDLFTVPDREIYAYQYEYCNIVQVNANYFHYLRYRFHNLLYHKLLRRNDDSVSPFGLAVNDKIKKKKYDYILIENNMYVYNSIKSRSKKIFHLHNNLDKDRPDYLCRRIIEQSNIVLNVSDFLKNEMNKVMFSKKNKTFYNCVDFSIFNPNTVDRYLISDFKEKNNIKDNDFVFIYTGRIVEEKGVLELVIAFKKICEKYSNVKLIIVGKGWFGSNEKSEYEQNIEIISQSVNDKIVCTGFVQHDLITKTSHTSNGNCTLKIQQYRQSDNKLSPCSRSG